MLSKRFKQFLTTPPLVTATIGGRGGEGCRADDWFIVEECNEDCYEFGWRASYPSYCDVEDIWLWCCDPSKSDFVQVW